MSGHDAAWDEDRGGPRDPLNLISFPMDGNLHKSTKKVLRAKAGSSRQSCASFTSLRETHRRLPSYRDYDEDIAARLALRHLAGDGNVPSDLVSRALWAEFRQLCKLLRVRPVHVTLEERELELISGTITGIHWSRMDEMLFDPNGSQLVHIGILPMLLPGFLAPQQHQKYSEYVFGRIEEYANDWREAHGGSYFLDWPHPWAMFLLFFMVFELGFVGLLAWQAVIPSAMMGVMYLASGYVLRTEVAGKSQRKA